MHHFKFLTITIWILSTLDVSAQLVEKGTIDLSAVTFDDDTSVPLQGEWEFYWNKLLSPRDLMSSSPAPEWIQVPASWHIQKPYAALGHATYRIHITLPEIENSVSVYFPIINASAKIWVNDILIVETGAVDVDKNHYTAKLTSTVVPLPPNVRDLDIIIQVANYSYSHSGITSKPILGRSSYISAKVNRSNGIENFFAGSLFALFIYHIVLYFLFTRGKPYLLLSLICLGVALRAMIVHGGSFLLPNLLPQVDWEYWKKIEFASVYGIIALFPLYVYHLFPDQAPRKPIVFFTIISALLCTTVIVMPQYIYGKLLDVCHIALVGSFVYAVYSIRKASKTGNKDAKIILFGILSAFPFILMEILKNSLLYPLNIQFTHLVELGVLIFLLFQVYLLAGHYQQSYRNLETLNLNLESIVEERTAQLTTANTVKDRLLSVISHDIKSPLNSLRGILQIYNRGAISKEEFNHFSKHLEDDLAKTNMLVENILHWTAGQLKGIQVKDEVFNLNDLIEENRQLFETIANNKKISILNKNPEALRIKADRNILNLVLRNLLSNAIKFSFEGGKIEIYKSLSNQLLVIQVKDEGLGMDEETQNKLFGPNTTFSTAGTGNEKGTGLGLSLCRDYLIKAGGQLSVTSKRGEGSLFNMTLTTEEIVN